MRPLIMLYNLFKMRRRRNSLALLSDFFLIYYTPWQLLRQSHCCAFIIQKYFCCFKREFGICSNDAYFAIDFQYCRFNVLYVYDAVLAQSPLIMICPPHFFCTLTVPLPVPIFIFGPPPFIEPVYVLLLWDKGKSESTTPCAVVISKSAAIS